MPTTKPRIAVTLEPNDYEVVQRLSELTGDPKSRIIAELMQAVIEPLRRTVALLEAAQSAPIEIKQGLRNTVETMERELYQVAGHSLEQMDWLIDTLQARPGGRQAGLPASGPDSDPDGFEAYSNARMKSRPPLCNTGVRSPVSVDKSKRKKPSKPCGSK